MAKQRFGWIAPDQRDYSITKSYAEGMAQTAIFSAEAYPLKDTGAGKVALPYKILADFCGGEFPVNRQGIGDCVSHGWAKSIELLLAIQAKITPRRERWPGVLVATEWLYGTGRVLQGGGRLGNSDGSLGVWQAKAVRDNGVLFRQKYTQDGKDYDLSQYDAQRAKSWGYRGLPTGLEVIADEHPVGRTAMVTTWEEVRDSLANGYPVAVCSQQGFTERRDEDGFARPSGTWAHCMAFIGMDDVHKRPGALCMNSWGPDWISGPTRHDQPAGSFWVDADVVQRMVAQKDSHALADATGFKARKVSYVF